MDELEEYRNIQSGYSDLFKSMQITTSNEHTANIRHHQITIETLEGQRYEVKVSKQGWYYIIVLETGDSTSTSICSNVNGDRESCLVLNDRTTYYETFEALAMFISPAFNLKFHENLTGKLTAMEEQNEEDRLRRFT